MMTASPQTMLFSHYYYYFFCACWRHIRTNIKLYVESSAEVTWIGDGKETEGPLHIGGEFHFSFWLNVCIGTSIFNLKHMIPKRFKLSSTIKLTVKALPQKAFWPGQIFKLHAVFTDGHSAAHLCWCCCQTLHFNSGTAYWWVGIYENKSLPLDLRRTLNFKICQLENWVPKLLVHFDNLMEYDSSFVTNIQTDCQKMSFGHILYQNVG